jgi:hypothetical protein
MVFIEDILSEIRLDEEELKKIQFPKDSTLEDPVVIEEIGARFWDIIKKEATRISNIILEQRPLILSSNYSVREAKEEKIHSNWSELFDDFLLFLLLCADIGATITDSMKKRRSEEEDPEDDPVWECLLRLEANAVRIGFEILALMRAGYPDGAYARWRSMHENCITALFINKHGNDTAARFLKHHYMEALQGFKKYNESKQDYYNEFPDLFSRDESVLKEQEQECKRIAQELCEQYGENYKFSYGWAAEALSRGPKGKVTFSDIEKNVNWDHLRLAYQNASFPVHATSTSIYSFLGTEENNSALVGPSNIGMNIPASSAVYSMSNITGVLIMLAAKTDSKYFVLGSILESSRDTVNHTISKLESQEEIAS